MQPPAIEVLTYNIHKGFSLGNREFVLHQMRDQLRASDIDIVFLQEIQGRHTRHEERISGWPDESQCEYLAESIWPHYTYGKNAIYNSGHHGNAILSKFPFIHRENLIISSLRVASRSILHGIISLPSVRYKLHVICIHLDFIAFERRRQLRILGDWFNKNIPSTEPVILAGDFNDWRGEVERDIAGDLELKEIFRELHGRHAKTYPSLFPVFPLDRIFFRGLKPELGICYRNHPWHRLSDHLPLYAKFRFNV